jgi:enamine deaminase RidA (YjgF/YER057c/UK114 family)
VTRKISSGTLWEPVIGYSRAVAAGDFVFVSGCTSVADGSVVHEGDAGAQTAQAIANVAQALERLGAGLADVVRTRMFVTDISRWEEYGRAHGAAFGDG